MLCSCLGYTLFSAIVLGLQCTVAKAYTIPPPFIPINDVRSETAFEHLLQPLPSALLEVDGGSGDEVSAFTSSSDPEESARQLETSTVNPGESAQPVETSTVGPEESLQPIEESNVGPEKSAQPLVQRLQDAEASDLGSKPGVYAFANYKDFAGGFGFVRSDKRPQPSAWEKLLGLVVDVVKVMIACPQQMDMFMCKSLHFFSRYFLCFFRLP